ncbi:MAG: hypothetical protein WCY58_02180 [Mariniphaga sp.]|nr:hypothetical protein [Mariniphaga sp.]
MDDRLIPWYPGEYGGRIMAFSTTRHTIKRTGRPRFTGIMLKWCVAL